MQVGVEHAKSTEAGTGPGNRYRTLEFKATLELVGKFSTTSRNEGKQESGRKRSLPEQLLYGRTDFLSSRGQPRDFTNTS